MSITVRLKPKSYVTAYHCMACGAPCAKDTMICPYCRTRYEDDAVDSIFGSKSRLLVDCGHDFVYFPIEEIEEFNPSPEIDCTLASDYQVRRIPGLRDAGDTFNLGVATTQNTLKKFDNVQKLGIVKMRVEIGGFHSGFDVTGSFSYMLSEMNGVGEVAMSKLAITPYSCIGWQRLREPPTDLRCPNCGAPINSRTGCCDYCTGWVEWVDGI